jgi:hypothetical protein
MCLKDLNSDIQLLTHQNSVRVLQENTVLVQHKDRRVDVVSGNNRHLFSGSYAGANPECFTGGKG